VGRLDCDNGLYTSQLQLFRSLLVSGVCDDLQDVDLALLSIWEMLVSQWCVEVLDDSYVEGLVCGRAVKWDKLSMMLNFRCLCDHFF
jgi:hypothetical protein